MTKEYQEAERRLHEQAVPVGDAELRAKVTRLEGELKKAREKLEAVEEWADRFPLEAVRDARYELDCILKGGE